MRKIACIVEGHGEVEALPVLLRRVAASVAPQTVIDVLRPLRLARTRFLKQDHLERAVELMARRVGPDGGLVILLDADNECPKVLLDAIAHRTRDRDPPVPRAVVVAVREFEAWFLAGARSLAGKRGLPSGLEPPEDPESIRGAKEWLSARMQGSKAYSEILDQPAFAALLDLEQARATRSFRKLEKELKRLLLAE